MLLFCLKNGMGAGEWGAAKKGLFKRTLGCPWNIHMLSDSCLSPFLLSMARERSASYKRRYPHPPCCTHPPAHFHPQSFCSPRFPIQCAPVSPGSAAATKMSNYCKTSQIAVQLISSHWVEMHAWIAESITGVLCVFGKGRTPVVVFYPSLFGIYSNICQRK